MARLNQDENNGRPLAHAAVHKRGETGFVPGATCSAASPGRLRGRGRCRRPLRVRGPIGRRNPGVEQRRAGAAVVIVGQGAERSGAVAGKGRAVHERQRARRQLMNYSSTDLGDALTTVSMVAERAGVQRHTFYAHFPDERSLTLACSGLVFERDPLPDADPWRSIEDRRERLSAGLSAIYAWYARNADLTACVLRDGEHHALTREMNELRMGAPMQAYREVLGAGLDPRQRALLGLALSFFTWRTLTRESGLNQGAAVAAMVQAIGSARGI
jgi:AcrR family transcriptional regulator